MSSLWADITQLAVMYNEDHIISVSCISVGQLLKGTGTRQEDMDWEDEGKEELLGNTEENKSSSQQGWCIDTKKSANTLPCVRVEVEAETHQDLYSTIFVFFHF